MSGDGGSRHFVLLVIDVSGHGAGEMGHVGMAGLGFVNDVCSMMTRFVPKKITNKQEPVSSYKHMCFTDVLI